MNSSTVVPVEILFLLETSTVLYDIRKRNELNIYLFIYLNEIKGIELRTQGWFTL